MEVIGDDLDCLRTNKDLTNSQLARVEKVIEAISISLGGADRGLDEARRSIMLAPWKHIGWSELADAADREGGSYGEGDVYASTMARETAWKNAPLFGALDAMGLASATGQTGELGDVQLAVVLAPWRKEEWSSLVECWWVLSEDRGKLRRQHRQNIT
jgi:superkiller protein 3